MSQSVKLSGTTLKNLLSSGSSTMATCPRNTITAMVMNPSHPLRFRPLPPDLYPRALNRYQKWAITKMVKISVCS